MLIKSSLKQTFYKLRNALQGRLAKYFQEVFANGRTKKQQRIGIDAGKKNIAFTANEPERRGFI
jgi:hypothetical protein